MYSEESMGCSVSVVCVLPAKHTQVNDARYLLDRMQFVGGSCVRLQMRQLTMAKSPMIYSIVHEYVGEPDIPLSQARTSYEVRPTRGERGLR